MKIRCVLQWQSVLLLLFITFLGGDVLAQKNEDVQMYSVIDSTYTVMTNKRFDIEQYNKNKDNVGTYIFIEEDGSKIQQYFNGNIYLEYKYPTTKLYKIERVFSIKGFLTKEYMTLGEMLIGTFYEFDEEGNKTRAEDMEVDLPQKIDYNQVMLLMDKEKKINVKTGEGREDFTMGYDKKKNRWNVLFSPSGKNNHLGARYEIDANSGKIKAKHDIRSW